MQLSCSEIKEFVASIGHGSVSDNDLRIFVNFLDIDRSGLVSKAEFLANFLKNMIHLKADFKQFVKNVLYRLMHALGT